MTDTYWATREGDALLRTSSNKKNCVTPCQEKRLDRSVCCIQSAQPA
ncbi:hypothetical protein SAMN05216604_13441 [Pseudomonas agarici]|nr:hypothetical protein SAMN05216604_13441 [Pseudomonas agarici]